MINAIYLVVGSRDTSDFDSSEESYPVCFYLTREDATRHANLATGRAAESSRPDSSCTWTTQRSRPSGTTHSTPTGSLTWAEPSARQSTESIAFPRANAEAPRVAPRIISPDFLR